MNEEIKPVKIKGVAYWASLTKVNSMSGKYQVDISNLSEAAVKALEDLGLTILHKDQQGFYITCKSNYEIFAVDPSGDRIEGMVGNGSEVVAVISTFPWQFKNKKGLSASIKKLVVTKMVKYDKDDTAAVDDGEEAL